MSGKIVITGAPGNIGSEVVAELRALGTDLANVRVAARDIDRARSALGADLSYVPFDFLNPATFGPAFEGADRLFLVRPPQLGNVRKEIAPAVTAAVAAGVRQIVFLSIQGVESMSFVPHAAIETLIRCTGVAYTFLRAGFFMQNLSTVHREEIRRHDEIALPMGHALTAFIDARDVGSVGARVITQPGHENRIYTLTGGEALDYDQVCALLTEVLGRPIRYRSVTPLGFFLANVRTRGVSMAAVMTLLYTLTRGGNAKDVSGDAPRILGRPTIILAQFVHDFRHLWLR